MRCERGPAKAHCPMVVNRQADGSRVLSIATAQDDQFNDSLALVVYAPFAMQDLHHM